MVSCAGDLRPAMIDRSQLDSTLLNLCIKARNARPDGGRLILETAYQRLDAGRVTRPGWKCCSSPDTPKMRASPMVLSVPACRS